MWSEVYTSGIVANRTVPPLARRLVRDTATVQVQVRDRDVGKLNNDSERGSADSIRSPELLVNSSAIPQTASSLARLLSSDSAKSSGDHPTGQALSFLTSTDRSRLDFKHLPTMNTFIANLEKSSTQAHAGALLHPSKHEEKMRTIKAVSPFNLPAVKDKEISADDELVDLFFALGGTEFKEIAEVEQAVFNPSVWLQDFRSRLGLDAEPSANYFVNFVVERNGKPRVIRTAVPKDQWIQPKGASTPPSA